MATTQQSGGGDKTLQYYQLVSSGTPAKDAFYKVWPNGIPSKQDQAKVQADAQQKGAYGQAAGILVTALAARGIMKYGPSLFGNSATTAATTATTPALAGQGSQLTAALSNTPGTGASVAANPAVGSAANGGTLFADGSATSGVGPIADGGAYSSQLAGSSAAAPGAFDLAGIGTAGNVYLPAVGALGAYDVLKNKKHGMSGALEGAASGAAIGSYGGPVGAVVGAGVGGLVGYFGNFGDVNAWQNEQNSVNDLAKNNVTGWSNYASQQPQLTKGRSPAELLAIEQQNAAAGKHSNTAFAQSRNVADLNPEDIWGYSAFGQKFGNDWFGKFSEDQRRQIAASALNAGAVTEGKGQIQIDWSKIPQAGTTQGATNNNNTTVQSPAQSAAYQKANLKLNAKLGDSLISSLGK